MTVPLFLKAFGGDDTERLRHFHRRLSNDDVARDVRTRANPSETIGGVPVADVLSRLRAGDETALTAIYDALFTSLWRIAALHTNSADVADDIVHDVFLRLWMRRDQLDAIADLRVYLSSAVRNRARDLGKHAHVVEHTVKRTEAAAVSGISQSVPETDASVESQEFLVAYRAAITLLSDQERMAALLRWEEQFTLEQIAGVLSMSVMGARGVVLRAQRKVQDALRKFR